MDFQARPSLIFPRSFRNFSQIVLKDPYRIKFVKPNFMNMFSKDEEIDSETSNMTSAVEEVFSKDEKIDSETSNLTPTDGKLCRI